MTGSIVIQEKAKVNTNRWQLFAQARLIDQLSGYSIKSNNAVCRLDFRNRFIIYTEMFV